MKLFNVPLRLVSAYLFAPCATLCVMVALTSRAYALQPLEAFIASAQRANPDNQQAVALARQRAAQNNVALAPYLPSLTAQSTYTRNEYQVTFDLAPGRSTVVTPQNALDAYVTLAVPLINVGAWAQQRAASLNAKAAEASRERIALSVEADVVRAYYRLAERYELLQPESRAADVAADPVALINDVIRWATKHLRAGALERDAKLIVRRLEAVRDEIETLKSRVLATTE